MRRIATEAETQGEDCGMAQPGNNHTEPDSALRHRVAAQWRPQVDGRR
jgi:hypothetical protein